MSLSPICRISQVLSEFLHIYCPHTGVKTGCDTHLRAYLRVHGPVEHFSVTDPDDRRSRFGVVSMTGQIERVPSPEAHHRPSINDWVLRGNWNKERGYTLTKLQWNLGGMSRDFLSGWYQSLLEAWLLLFVSTINDTCAFSLTLFKHREYK